MGILIAGDPGRPRRVGDQGYNVDLAPHLNTPQPQDVYIQAVGWRPPCNFPMLALLWSSTWGVFLCREAFQGSLFYLNKDKELVQCQRCPTGVKRQLCSNTNGARPKDAQLWRGGPGRRQSVPANQKRGCLSKGTVLCMNDDRFILQSASQIMALFHLLSYMLSKHHKPFCAMCFWKSQRKSFTIKEQWKGKQGSQTI